MILLFVTELRWLLQKLANDVSYFQMGNVCQGLFVCSYSLPEFGCWLLQNRETVKCHFQIGNVCSGPFL